MPNLIMESKSKKQKPLKNCYGTKEWSANSGICRNCKYQKECGKVKEKVKSKK